MVKAKQKRERMVRINVTVSPDLLERVDYYAKLSLEDRSTAVRQLLVEGLKVKLESPCVRGFPEGKSHLTPGGPNAGRRLPRDAGSLGRGGHSIIAGAGDRSS